MKQYDDDDGRTIADMNVDGMPPRIQRRKKSEVPSDITRKERRKILQAYFSLYMPRLLCMVLGISLALAILWLWMH